MKPDASTRVFRTLADVYELGDFKVGTTGPPHPFLVARPLRLADDPELLAEAAGGLVFVRRANHLVMYEGEGRRRRAERLNLWWAFRAELVAAEGAVVVRGLEVGRWPPFPGESELGAAAPFRGLSAEVLRAIRPGWIVRQALGYLERLEVNMRLVAEEVLAAHGVDWSRWAEHRRALEQTLERAEQASGARRQRETRGGPPRRTDEHYEAVAALYLELYERGERRGIHKAIAARYGYAERTAAHWIREARRRGFLAKGSRGRAEAQPGPRLGDGQGQRRGKGD